MAAGFTIALSHITILIPCIAPVPLQDVSNGLDRAVQPHMSTVYTMLNMTGIDPTLLSDSFVTVWNIMPDIRGGRRGLTRGRAPPH